MNRIYFLTLMFSLPSFCLFSQPENAGSIENLIIRTGEGEFSLTENTIVNKGSEQLYFYYNSIDEVAQVDLLVAGINPADSSFTLLPSGDFIIIDPLQNAGKDLLRMKLRFSNLSNNNFLQFVIQQRIADTILNTTVPLLAISKTRANFFPQSDELFLGEEKIFEIVSDKPQNIAITPDWISSGSFKYRVERKFEQLNLHLIPGKSGSQTLEVKLKLNSPFIDDQGMLSTELPSIRKNFRVLQSRLGFLASYMQEIVFDDTNRKEGVEIQLDDSPRLKLGKTYRIENQEEAGGALIAELFTKSRLSNNRILCLARVYNLHRNADGYLYIKDGDEAINLTNFSITPEMKISSIQIMKEGDSWTSSLNVMPGETIDIKVEGQGLLKAAFVWNNATDLTTDTTLRTDNVAFFRIQVPINVNSKRIALFNKGEDTGQGLNVKEYQEPRNFDFVTVNYGTGDRIITALGGPVIHKKVIKDILIDFDYNKIDSENKLYGKQYIEVDVRITGKNRELIEMTSIPVFGVCPGELSPRHPYYYKKDCVNSGISLNKYLSRKTYDLDDWVRIQLTFKHENSKYESRGMVQNTEFIVQKDYQFDIDVSFPAGLIIKTFNDESGAGAFDNFGGISMAMMAQFSFYDQERIGKFKPYKVGAGFLALNAFNFNENVSRDVAIVILGSLYPTRKDVKLTFPLYMGGGIWLGTGKPFVVLGPGIRVSL